MSGKYGRLKSAAVSLAVGAAMFVPGLAKADNSSRDTKMPASSSSFFGDVGDFFEDAADSVKMVATYAGEDLKEQGKITLAAAGDAVSEVGDLAGQVAEQTRPMKM